MCKKSVLDVVTGNEVEVDREKKNVVDRGSMWCAGAGIVGRVGQVDEGGSVCLRVERR